MYILKGKSLFPIYQLNTVSLMNNLMNLFVLSKSNQVLVNITWYLCKQIVSTFSFLKLFNTSRKLVHRRSCTYLLVMLLFFEKTLNQLFLNLHWRFSCQKYLTIIHINTKTVMTYKSVTKEVQNLVFFGRDEYQKYPENYCLVCTLVRIGLYTRQDDSQCKPNPTLVCRKLL